MSRQLYQSQYILQKCFENKENVIRVTLNNAQDYLNAVFDPSKDALRVNMTGGALPMVDSVDDLPSYASDGQICPVYNSEKDVIDFYEWVDALGEWVYRGSTMNGNAIDGDEKDALEWLTEHLDQIKEVADYNYIVNVCDIYLDPNNRVVEVQGQMQDIDDDLDGDADNTTPFRIDISGYVLSISTYADNDAIVPDRYYTRITYEAGNGGLGNSHIFMQQDEYDYFAALNEGKNIIRVYYLTNATTSPIKKKRLTLNPDGTAIDEEGENYSISDADDTDGDLTTPYCIDIGGYVLGVETFADQDALVPDKCYVKMVYESDGVHSGRSHVYIDADDYEEISGFGNGKNVIYLYYLHTVFPASVTISEMQYQFPADSVNYVVLDPSGNVKNVSDVPDKDGDTSTHVRITVNGYALDMDGYYNSNDPIKHRIIVKMNYNSESDTTDIYLDREHYEYVCSLTNGRNIVSIYTVGAGIGVDANRIGNNASKVHIWKGRLNSMNDLSAITAPDNGDTYQIGNMEYSWNGYEWVELGDNSQNRLKETPIEHLHGDNVEVYAGGCYRWSVADNTNATFSFHATTDTMSTTLIDIELGSNSTVDCPTCTMMQVPMAGGLNRCRIEFDGTIPRLYAYEVI